MARGGHVAVVAIGELDHEGFREGVFLAEFHPGLGEGLAGGGAEADVADFQELHGQLGLGRGLGEALDPSGVSERQDGLVADARGASLGLAGPGEEFFGNGAPFHIQLAVAGVERRLTFPIERGHGGGDFRGEVVSHELHLLVRLLTAARLAEIDVVEVAAGAVGHHRDDGRILFL